MASIICRYLDGTSQICYTDNYLKISDIKVNGISIGVEKYYNVDYSDEVEFVLSDTNVNVITSMFSDCYTLVSVTVGEGVEEIEDYGFKGCCSLQSIILPTTLISIGGGAFEGCCSLKTIMMKSQYMENSDITHCFSNVGYNGTLYYPSNCDYSNWLNSDDYYTGLGYYGWSGVKKSVSSMSSHNISIDSTTSSITMKLYPDSVITINEKKHFSNIYLNGVSIIDKLEEIGNVDYYLPDYYTVAGDEIRFILKNHTIYYGMFTSPIGIYQEIVGMTNVKVIGGGAFNYNSLMKVKLSSGVEVICDFAFSESSNITSIVIPDTVTTISNTAFRECEKLETITIGKSVPRIPLLSDAYSLNAIYLKNDSCGLPYNNRRNTEGYDCFFGEYINQADYIISGVTIGGTLYYPTGADYSQWLSTDPFNLGYFEWNGVGMNPDDMPSIEDYDSTEFSLQSYDYLIFDAAGGTQLVDVSVNGTVSGSLSWRGTLDDYGSREFLGEYNDNPVTVIYSITMDANDGAARTTYFTVTGTDSMGSASKIITIYQKDNNGNLPNDFNEDMSTGCYINLDSYEYTFPATGGTYFVRAEFGYPGTDGLKTRVYKGAVYPIAWCATELNGGEVDDDGTEANEVWKITMLENTGDVRECSISFSYTNNYGESTSVVFTARQAAAEGEEGSNPTVSAFTTTAKIKADGTPEITSFTSIRCGYNKVTILPPTVNGSWITLGAGGAVSGTFIGYDEVRQYPISFAANEGDARTGTITFSGTDASGNTLTSICNITQAAAGTGGDDEDPEIPVTGDEYIGPIWKDIEYSFGGAEMIEYGIYSTYKTSVGNSIVDVDTLLFAGRSYRRPTNGENSIYVNKICQSYMEAPLLSEEYVSTGVGYKVFKLKSGDGTTTYRTYRFINDWSYSDDFRTGLLSRPILNDNTKVFRNQWLPFTVFGANDTVSIPYGIQYGGKQDEYGVTIPDWNSIVSITNGVVTEMFPYPSIKDGAVSYTINGITYPIVDECVQYVLYYVNPWGGYDWFPIRGKVVERDLMTAYTYMQNYNNQTIEFGKKKYLADIRKQFTLHTQWMSEEESSRMWYLLQSNTVYLHNLVEDKIYPAVITNTEQEHKKRLRGQRISYQIDVELSQTRQRI